MIWALIAIIFVVLITGLFTNSMDTDHSNTVRENELNNIDYRYDKYLHGSKEKYKDSKFLEG